MHLVSQAVISTQIFLIQYVHTPWMVALCGVFIGWSLCSYVNWMKENNV